MPPLMSELERRNRFRQTLVNRLGALAADGATCSALEGVTGHALVEVQALSALLAELDRSGAVPTGFGWSR